MTTFNKKTIFSLASIYSFRMLGLFMILPIFSIYAHQLPNSTPTLIGLALGVYGLTQAILQIPFGMTSDKVGRKPVIAFGLVLFAIGSVVAALSHGIYGIILGRAIQGAGAVGSTVTALVADSTDEDQRMKAMAMIGMTIGLSFVIAMILGPILNGIIGVPGIFWLTAILGLFGIVILYTLVPTPKTHLHRDAEVEPVKFKSLLKNKELLRLDFGIFTLHAILTASFIVIPLALYHSAGLSEGKQWMVYLPVLVLAFFAMVPFIIIAESKRKMKQVFVGAIAVIALTQLLLWPLHSSTAIIAIILFLFFTAFTLLEASLPSLIAKLAPAGSKGTAMGIYSSAQFLGIFIGGLIGGFAFHLLGFSGVFIFCAILALIWLYLAATMKPIKFLSTKLVHVGKTEDDVAKVLQEKLLALEGVADALVCPDEGTAHLKIDKKIFDEDKLKTIVESV